MSTALFGILLAIAFCGMVQSMGSTTIWMRKRDGKLQSRNNRIHDKASGALP